jgi:hypothetical protein
METEVELPIYCEGCEQWFPNKFEFVIHANIVDDKGERQNVYHGWSSMNPDHERMKK